MGNEKNNNNYKSTTNDLIRV